ncbi:MAG TPA: SMP-30/gluconolactonase/LRE family protein [Phycisphaerae bacterium]|nr:SMP-30/gluconolactonase/LRE family protein [Phycisphaerae bacterium]
MPSTRGIILVLSLAVAAVAGCEPPPLSDNGVVGVFGGIGLADGRFSYPRAIAVGSDGSIYVVDKTARIQRFDTEGAFVCGWHMPEKLAGKPVGLSVHPDGRLFVPDTHYYRVLVYDGQGTLLTQFGERGDGPGQFQLPTDVAFDREGFIYVGEYAGNDRITKWTPDLQYVSAIGEEEIDGRRLARPAGIDIDDEQTLWVADACNHRIVRFSLDGEVLAVFGEMGKEPGQLRYPYDITVTPQDTLLVCEYGNSRLQWFDKDGRSLGVWGEPGRQIGQVWSPWGAAVGADGRVYVVDSYNNRVQIVRPR